MTDGPADVLDTQEAGPQVIRGSAIRIGGYVAGVLVGVASSAVLFRHLGVVDAGRFVTVLALIAIVGGISDLGLSGVAVREFTVRSGADRDRFMRNVLGMRIVYTTAGIAAAVGFALIAGYTDAMVVGTAFAGFGLLLFILQQTLTTPLQVNLRLGWVTLLHFLAQAGVAAGILVLALAGAGLVPLLAVQIPAMVPVIALTVWVVRGQTPLVPAFDLSAWRLVMTDVLAYSAAVVFTVLYFRIVAILMSLLSTPEETGYYAVAFRVLDALTLIPPLLASTAFPVLARAGRDDLERLDYALGRLTEAMLLVGVGIALVLLIGAEVAIDIVAGPDFGPSVEVLQLLAPAIIGTFLLATWGYALLSIREHRAILISNALALTVAGGASAVLIPAHGANGAAISLTLAELTLAIAYGVSLTRARSKPPAAARILPRVALAAGVAAGVALLLPLTPVPATFLAVILYGALLLALGAVPWEIAAAFRRARPDSSEA